MSGREGPTSRALWFVGPRRVEVRDEPLPAVGPGSVRLRALASGISQGTELLLYRGEGPTPFDPSIAGAETYPCRYGYAWVGEVVACGAEAMLTPGTRVFALAPHGSEHVLRADEVWVLPSDVPATRAVLAANLETALTCVWDAETAFGDRTAVFGGGVVGLLTAWLLLRSGAYVTVVEASEERRRIARDFLPSAHVRERLETGADMDRVVEATGRPEVLDDAIAAAGFEARVVVASFYGARRAHVDLGNAFHRKRLELRATQVSNLPARQKPRWDYDRRFRLVAELLREPTLDALFAPPVEFEKAVEVYESLDAAKSPLPAHVFVYR